MHGFYDALRMELALHMAAGNGDRPAWFFQVKKVGRLRLGIGSALSAKYLARVEGPTLAADDDIMLEAKELLDRQGVACVRVEPGPSRIFTTDSRIAYQPFRYPGVIHLGDKTLWVHAWPDNYVELAIQSLSSPQELRDVAYDVGVQLGRRHPKMAHDASSAPASERAIQLDDRFGFHPALAPLMPAWKAGRLPAIHASGSPDESRSHFQAMELMERGLSTPAGPASGWLARLLTERLPS